LVAKQKSVVKAACGYFSILWVSLGSGDRSGTSNPTTDQSPERKPELVSKKKSDESEPQKRKEPTNKLFCSNEPAEAV
jgi:hypothetical protein